MCHLLHEAQLVDPVFDEPQTPELMLSRAVGSRIALVCGSREPSGVHVSARYWSAVLYTIFPEMISARLFQISLVKTWFM